MHRQSLGSPASKLHIHGVSVPKEEFIAAEDSRKVQLVDLSPSSLDDEDSKQTKPQRVSLQAGRLIHLIPVLMLFCFLVLYLCSHSPSQSDFSTFKLHSKHIDSAQLNQIGRLNEVQEDDVMAVGRKISVSSKNRRFLSRN